MAMVFVAAQFMAGAAFAGHVPSVHLCDVPSHLVSCPGGDMVDHFLIRRVDNSPDEFIDVTLSTCGCPGVHIAPLVGHESYTVDSACVMIQETNFYGVADFYPHAGGVCSGDPVLMTAFFVPLGTRQSWASPDQDGDLAVTTSDLVTIQQKVGTSDPTADLDGDGLVTSADLALAQTHLGHSSATAVGVEPGLSTTTSLSQSWPNPCRRLSTIAFRLAKPERVSLAVFDAGGRKVSTLLLNEPLQAGPHEAWLDVRHLATGVYLYRLRAGAFVATRRMIVTR
jgi:hypothetical protein